MFTLLYLVAVAPTTFEDIDMLDQKIEAIAQAEPVDKRLKLAKCPEGAIIAPPLGDVVIVRCPSIGWRLRVSVKSAAQADIAAQIIIRKGDMVECITSGPGFAVSTQMIALDDAKVGQNLRVKSLTSPTSMHAIAIARGRASL